MVDDGITFLRDERYESFIEDGKLIAPLSSVVLFNKIWQRIENDCKTIHFPSTIVWLNGAPGSGKGVNTRNVMRALSISTKPIIVSDLLHTPEFQEKIDKGLLIDDEEVSYLVFKTIIQGNRNESGIIIDGFPRTVIQAELLRLLKKQLSNDTRMISVVLLIDEKTSIARQRTRGLEAIEHNRLVKSTGRGELHEVRATDTDDDIARTRYATFRDKTIDALKYLKDFTDYYDIDAKGSFEEVRDRIYAALKKR